MHFEFVGVLVRDYEGNIVAGIPGRAEIVHVFDFKLLQQK